MTQDLGAETNRKNRGIPEVVCRDFFNSFMLQEIAADCRFQFRSSGSNISEALEPNRAAFLGFIRPILRGDLDERFDLERIGAARLAARDCFVRFGLADSAIMELAHDPLVILTNDRRMARYRREEEKRLNVFYFGDLKERCLGAN